jgi:hypothetical protein
MSFLKYSLFFKNKFILINLILSILLASFTSIWLYSKITPSVEPVALHYTIYFGIDLIAPWYHVFIFPLIGFLTILINFTLAYLLFIQTKILAYLLALVSSVVQGLLVIISILVSLLNK